MIQINCSHKKIKEWLLCDKIHAMFDMTSPYLHSLDITLQDGEATQICLNAENEYFKTKVFFNCIVKINKGAISFAPRFIKQVVEKTKTMEKDINKWNCWENIKILNNGDDELNEWIKEFVQRYV